MKNLVFDLEVLPRWWCMVYTNPDDITDLRVISSDTKDFRKAIKSLIVGNCFIGFNIKNYDMRILNAILAGCDTYRIYELSKAIINKTEDYFNNYTFWNKFNFSDLFDDWRFGSLKEFESNSGMDIMESSIPFDREYLSEADKAELITYCKHDVTATVELLKYRKSYIDSKIALSEMFNIPIDKALKSTNAKLCAIILKAEPKNREIDYNFVIPDRVKDYIFANVPKDIISMFEILTDENKEANLFGNNITFGIGGIHSTCGDDVLVRTNENELLFDIDVTSYYPHLIMVYNYMSRNVADPKEYEKIYNLRATIKKQSQVELNEHGKTPLYYKLHGQQLALKLILNTTYGAMKNKYNALYDWHQASSLCYLGQLMLCGLCNKLYNNVDSVHIIQTNTDGILVKCAKKDLDSVKAIVSEWETTTGMPMEYDFLKIFFQRDVNNYIGVKENGRIVLKGKWSNQADEDRPMSNLNAPIAHKAVLNYYLKNIPIKDTVYAGNDPMDFCFTTKTGKNYDATYYYINNEPRNTNKVNRVVASLDNNKGTLKKFKKDENRYDKIAEIPNHCTLVNGELTFPPDIDKDWYVEFATNKLKELREI